MSDRGVSIVVPVYNSQATIAALLGRIRPVLAGRESEIILVDDGSTDGSRDTIRRLALESTDVRAVILMRNYGQHNALLAGIELAGGRVLPCRKASHAPLVLGYKHEVCVTAAARSNPLFIDADGILASQARIGMEPPEMLLERGAGKSGQRLHVGFAGAAQRSPVRR